MDNLRTDPLLIEHSDVEILSIYEVDYDSGVRKNG